MANSDGVEPTSDNEDVVETTEKPAAESTNSSVPRQSFLTSPHLNVVTAVLALAAFVLSIVALTVSSSNDDDNIPWAPGKFEQMRGDNDSRGSHSYDRDKWRDYNPEQNDLRLPGKDFGKEPQKGDKNSSTDETLTY